MGGKKSRFYERGAERIERLLVLIQAELPKVVQTNGRLVHHGDDLLFLRLQLLDLPLLLLQLGSSRLQVVVQVHFVLRVTVV